MERHAHVFLRNKRIWMTAAALLLAVAAIMIGVRVFSDRSYLLISVCIALFACVPFYFAYERQSGSTRRLVILAVMVTMAVAGRLLFAPIPSFKPVAAIVIVTAVYMGAEAGFLTGSLAALVSDLFFGQGPWTPFRMLSWGLVGFTAGLPFLRERMKNPVVYVIYGIFAALFYSAIMNVWAVLSLDGSFSWSRYLAAAVSGVPTTVLYAVSNVVFLLLTMRTAGKKLERIHMKHQIF